jgi:TRAP-type uncharacterized transport system fused permease subunit
MARLRLEQLLSNMSFDSGSNQLTISGSDNALIISGSALVVSTAVTTGSFTIQGIDNFGDSGSFFTLDLGDY